MQSAVSTAAASAQRGKRGMAESIADTVRVRNFEISVPIFSH